MDSFFFFRSFFVVPRKRRDGKRFYKRSPELRDSLRESIDLGFEMSQPRYGRDSSNNRERVSRKTNDAENLITVSIKRINITVASCLIPTRRYYISREVSIPLSLSLSLALFLDPNEFFPTRQRLKPESRQANRENNEITGTELNRSAAAGFRSNPAVSSTIDRQLLVP